MSLDEVKRSPLGFDPEIPRISVAHSSREFSTLVDVLRHRAAQQPHQLSHSFLVDGETEEISLTYAELEQRAMCIAALLQGINATGQRVLLLYPPGLEYIAAFFGCLYAGAVAVPAYPPRMNRSLWRLQAIAKDAQPVAALSTASIVEKVDKLLDRAPELKNVRWINTDNISLGYARQWREPRIEDTTLAFLQYTSGSTSTPKGVMVSHGNLLHNERTIKRVFGQNEDSIIVGWLPLYHDMGLIGNVLQPLFLGRPCILMSPVAFLQRPLRWLQAISRYRATTSGGPNFAFDLCVNKISFEERETLDLSSWKVAFNGAEPIRSETIERFVEAFAPCGFRREAFYPCYGLAEATLLVSGKLQARPPLTEKIKARELLSNRVVRADKGNENLHTLVSCGSSLPDQEILIINPDSSVRCDADAVGEIWVAGPSVAQGYWNRPDESKRTFQARLAGIGEGPFLRTGDLGFIHDGELFVTGRLKDLIIIRGMNHYPQDIELTIEQAHRNLRPGCGAAFSIAVHSEEQLVVVQELADRHPSDWPAIVEAMVQAVAERHELQLHAVVLVKPNSIPKTSSGKIQRHLCRDSFLADKLEAVFEWRATVTPDGVMQKLNGDQLLGSVGEIEVWLKEMFAERLGLAPSSLAVDQTLARYGIDSLIAVELVHSIEVLTGISLSLVTFLQDVTITELAIQLHARLQDTTSHEPPRPSHSVSTNTEHRPSIGQQALWFLHQLEPKSAAYNIARALRLRTQLDVTALRHAFQEAVNRHASLRTVFVGQDQLPMCRVRKDLEVCFLEEDATTWSDAFLSERLSEEARSPFNLENGPLLRIVLFTRSPVDHVLLLTVHHIVADFWSLGVLMKEVASVYEAELSGSQEILAPLTFEYADYTRSQTQMLQSEKGEHLWTYWQQQLSGDLPVVNLPVDKSRPLAQSFEGRSYNFKLSRALTSKLKSLAQAQGATLYMTLLASFQVLLYHYTGQEDILVGSPVAGRSHADFKNLVGYFVNPVVLRSDLSGRPRFTSFLKKVRQTALEAFAHQEFPFPLLVERLQPNRDLSRSPLFQIMFALQTTESVNDASIASFALGAPGGAVTLGALTFESLPLEQRIAQFDLTLLMADANEELTACFEYSTDLFEHSTIERMAGHFVNLLEGIVDVPEQRVTEYSVLTAAEQQQVVVEWNNTAAATGAGKCLHEYFEAQAEQTPGATALICGSEELTYAELNERANAVGQQLRLAGVGAEVRVGICLGRTIELVVGILGVLKAGGAYVPLDPAYPQERLAYMLADSQATVILTSAEYAAQLPATPAQIIKVDSEGAARRRENLSRVVTAENLAYVIYTSGSTGAPKGVAIEHRSVAAFLEWTQTVFSAAQLQGTLAATSICFDLSVFEIFAPLACGGTVILAENILSLAAGLGVAARVTLVNTVPSAMAELLRLEALPASVATVNLAGEALTKALARQVYEQTQVRRLYNLYGPSEDTTYSTYQRIAAGAEQAPTIGRPIANTKAYILSAQQRIVPIGVSGELYLSGAGLARGYLGQAEKTAERFVPDPFSETGGRMYRTGDLARYLGNGEIEFLGRADQQVKVRGYRIELGEIEAVLAGHESVREAVVVVREESGGGQLACYVVAEEGQAVSGRELQRYLEERLPGYMVPVGWQALAELPQTPNGKVDRRALQGAELKAAREYVAARTATEQQVAAIWAAVLGVAQVGVEENFFELGGHSLLATQAVSRLRAEFGVEIALRWLFEAPTVARLAEKIDGLRGSEPGELLVPAVTRQARPAEVPMSFGQERLWFLHQLDPQSSAYNMSAVARLSGMLNASALEQTINELIRRHESLRTHFISENGQALQVIVPHLDQPLATEDLRALSEREKQAELARITAAEAQQPFDLGAVPLLRSRLLRLSEQEHALLLTTHHIIWDGWSTGIFLNELAALYEAFQRGAVSPLEELPIQYVDFALWQRAWAQSETLEKSLAYWKEQLTDVPPVLALPTDRPRPALQTYRGGRHAFRWPQSLSNGLNELGRDEGSTLFMTLLAGLQAFLYLYTKQPAIAVGTPVANRSQKELEGLIGFFVNTLVMRGQLSADLTFRELLKQVREVALEAYAHQDVPFEKLVEELQPERNLSHTPLFQVMLVLQNVSITPTVFAGLRLELLPHSSETAKFDLLFNFVDGSQGLTGELEYNQDLFDEDTIARMMAHLQTLLAGAVANPEQRLAELPLLTAVEQQQLDEWNNTAVAATGAGKCLHEYFEAQVAQTPGATALICGSEELTYAELNERANAVGQQLRLAGVGAEVRVGICLGRTTELVVGILGVLKAGGAYVPLDPAYPQERLAYMLADSQATVILTSEEYAAQLPATPAQLIRVDQAGERRRENLRGVVAAENLAYVIYTSGSTGAPKGVAIEHRSVAAFLEWTQTVFSAAQLQGTLAATSICFDLSVFEIFAPLACGGTVILAENILALAERLAAAARVTLVNTVPSAMAELLRLEALPASVETVNLAGEALTEALARQVYEQTQVRRLYNLYGPSEDTTYSTYQGIEAGAEQAPTIGRPIANTKAYILSAQQRVVPIGVSGELYLSGAGLARGYLGQAEKTAERFVPDPFSEAGARMYRTGDLARYLNTGEIEFLGRADQQVKVRGYRIELGEIEAVLTGHESVREAVVVVREESGGGQLACYVVLEAGQAVSGRELQRYLEERLPGYMVPVGWQVLAELPQTPNGKVDRRALQGAELKAAREYVAARTATEQQVAAIWAAVLGVGQVGVEENFFELGGHSLLATQAVSRLRAEFGMEIALRWMFESPTVARLAEKIDGLRGREGELLVPAVRRVARPTEVPASFGQERLWFLHQLDPQSAAYNMAAVVRLRGVLDAQALEQSLNELMRRHESLRTHFVAENGRALQVIAPHLDQPLVVEDLSALSASEKEAELARLTAAAAQHHFDLGEAPLLRSRLLKLSAQEHALLLTTHHIIWDGWSTGVFLNELAALYEAFHRGAPSPLAELPLQYADFALWQRAWAQSETMADSLAYWKEQLTGLPPVLALPTDRPRPALQTYRGGRHVFRWPQSLSDGLNELGRGEGGTLFMTLLAGLQAFLYLYTKQQSIAVGTPVANRSQKELEGLIGFFVNTLVLRAQLSADLTFRELLRQVREVALEAYAHQDVPFEKLVEELQPERHLSHSPLFQVMLVLQNNSTPALACAGLELELLPHSSETAKFDLLFNFVDGPAGLTGELEYNQDLFDEVTIARLTGHLQTLLAGAVAQPEQRLSALPLMTAAEQQQVVVEWNNTAAATGAGKCLHEYFEAQAEKTPGATALICGSEELTYAELNERANAVGQQLRLAGVGAEVRVGICLGRTIELVVGILGVLKAGGAYVPLDPAYPQERLAYMLADSQATVILTSEEYAAQLPATPAQLIRVDQAGQRRRENLRGVVTAENLAYVIYTSGSTGAPKGVAIEHRSVAAFLEWTQTVFSAAQLQGTLAATSICFDLSVFEIFAPLACGGTVILAENILALAEGLAAAAARVTLVNTVPSAMAELLRLEALPASVETVNLAGEALTGVLAQQVYEQTQVRRLYNLYGPSEDTTYSTYQGIAAGAEQAPTIGRPIANTKAYILSAQQRVVPIGVTGELYLSGAGLARGYLGQAEKTAERFVPDPFSEAGERMYRTGDLARYLGNGEIEFLGRADQQVKVRGYRIELGEIEAVLAGHESVAESVVLAREDIPGDKRLTAYLVANQGRPATATQLRSYLQQQLPDYMVPSAFIWMDALPQTPNGKVDRRALPVPDDVRPEAELPFAAPRTPVEEIVAGIWTRLLGLAQVGVHDNFFDLGGHSLLATQLISRVREALDLELPLRAIFESPTVAKLSEAIVTAQNGAQASQMPSVEPAPRDAEIPLSYAQQRLWFLEQLESDVHPYNMPGAVRLTGQLNVDALAQSLNEVIRRHEILRTTFGAQRNQPQQVIAAPWAISLSVTDLQDLSETAREDVMQSLIADEARRRFDLLEGPLFRTALLKLSEEDHVLLLTMHHIISDGWSIGVLIREITALYQAYSEGADSPLTALPIQYADFAIWQRQCLEGEAMQAQISYWRQQLQNSPPLLELPIDYPRPAIQTFRGASLPLVLPESLSAALKALSRGEDVTLFMTLLAAFAALLNRYTEQDDIAVGSPIAGRTQGEVESLIGCFVNTLVLRADLSGDPSFTELLGRVKETALAAYAHQDLPFEKLVEELQPERNLNRTPLFQVMFVMQNAQDAALKAPGLELTRLAVSSQTAKFDLTLALEESESGLSGSLQYNTDLFDAESIARMGEHFRTLLQSIADNPRQRLSSLPLLTEEEQHNLLVRWNDTATEYPAQSCLHWLFEAQAEQTPDAIATMFGNEEITYKDLNTRANNFAHHLRALGVGPEVLVGIMAKRSVEMVVGVLAILKAGGAYLPLEPEYPDERLSFILADSGASVVLAQSTLASRFADFTGTVVSLDEQPEASNAFELTRSVTPENLAYVIYTSGSTGQPKGVEVTHASVCNHLHWRQSAYPLSASDSFLQKASISFDISVWEIFAPLLAGARLVLAEPGGQRDSAYLGRLIAEKQITVAHFHPAMLRAVLQEPDAARWTSLRQVFCGGETLPRETQRLFFDTVSARLCHQYGPTETTIDVAAWDCSPDDACAVIPIGRPISNTRLYVLDGDLRPVPVGLPGELYVGGVALARAYLNRPELTAERFVPDPFSPEPGGRLYRTGDHARWLPDGAVQFLGRADAQVKVRGYRVELGEIEAALASHPEVREAAAAVHADASGERRLVGYVVARSERQPSITEIRNFLLQKLPDYMAPSSFVFLDSLPLTASGKVNRQALPLPDQSRPELDQAFVAPQTPVEQMIAGVWREVLGTEQIGVDDNFFELGGHSLLATQVVARLSEAFGFELPLRAIFESPTIAGLSEKIDTAVRSEQNVTLPPILPVSRDQDLPLSFPQERLWLLHQLHPRSVAYHVLRPLRIVGTLDVKLLERVLTEVVSRHEVYRTTIVTKQGRPVQIIKPPRPIELPVIDLSDLSKEEREEEVQQLITEEGQRPFNLAHGPLWRLTLLRLDEAEHLLMLTEHHVVHDGWTEGRLVLDFLALYAAMATGQPSPLPELSIQYADFAYWQRRTIQGELLESLLSYWRKQLADSPPMLELPGDFPRPAVMSFRGANSTWQFTPELTKALNVLSRREGATLYMTLLAAFNVLLHRYTRQEDLVIGTPIANRNHIETELLTGFFANTLVMRNDLSGNPGFKELLGRVREVALGAYMHQDMPFERLVEELQPDRALNRQPLFQVMFVLQNAPNPPVELPGLTVETLRVHNGTSKFDLLLAMREDGDRLTAAMEYNTDIFAENTIQRMLQHFQNLLEAIVANPEQRISELSLMKEAERQELLVDWNNTEFARRDERSIVQLFEDQVERTPDAVALIFQGESLTYKKLNERANQLAHFLQARGVGPEVFAGICMQRSVEMMVSVLGVLKAGGAYLPLDPTYPKERLAYMIGDTKAHVLLTQHSLLEVLPEHSAQVVCLDSYWKIIAQEKSDNPAPAVAPENLVYVTYTSGSTGKPKGIGMIQHSLLNLLDWMCRTTQLPEGARTVQFASLSFDVSFQDMFSTWFSGGTLVLLTEDERRDIVALSGVLNSNDVNRIFIPAVALQQLAEGLCAHDPQTSQLRRIIAGSEQLHVTQPIAKFFSQSQDCSLHNEYGPSETHVVTALSLPASVTSWPSRPPIGRPISNTQIYLLEESLQPAPIGVPGELYIGGVGLARGYLGRPDLTAEKFLPDPFSRQPGARFYRTGDLARYQPDGNIEFLGRKDHQVKIRGFRIELGEIETVLGQHPAVQETIVLTWQRTAGDRHLVAYVVFQPGSAPSISEMRNFLLEQLPDYMVPSSFIFLDSLPLTANGKVNRQALPLPDQSRPELDQAFVAPQTPLEQVIAGVWREVLGTEQIGVDDNFFELGGHSLLATQVVGRLSEAFEFELPLRAIFESPTIAGLAASMVQLEPAPGSLEAVAQLLLEFAELSEEDAQSLLDSHQAEDQTEISVG